MAFPCAEVHVRRTFVELVEEPVEPPHRRRSWSHGDIGCAAKCASLDHGDDDLGDTVSTTCSGEDCESCVDAASDAPAAVAAVVAESLPKPEAAPHFPSQTGVVSWGTGLVQPPNFWVATPIFAAIPIVRGPVAGVSMSGPVQTEVRKPPMPLDLWKSLAPLAASEKVDKVADPLRSRRRRRNRGEMRLAECLDELEACDPHCVLRITGMSRRGAEPAAVREYFESRYGPVETLLLANSLESRNIMGFLLMRDSADAARALAAGPVHEALPGASVKARAFERCQKKQV